MEALEFMRKRKRMCDYYGDDTCVCENSRGACPALDIDCSFTTEHPEHLIAIAEQWSKEHPEEPEQERGQERPKRTNKDVLVAAFPNVRMEDSGIPTVCPLSLDKHYNCSKFKNCEECGCAYWLAESTESEEK